MFENAGRKLKFLAKINFVFCIVFNSVLGIVVSELFKNDFAKNSKHHLYGFLIGFISGLIIGWILSILLYAFGELCENVYYIRHGEEELDDSVSSIDDGSEEKEINSETDTQEAKETELCPQCRQYHLNEYGVCMKCGYEKMTPDNCDFLD